MTVRRRGVQFLSAAILGVVAFASTGLALSEETKGSEDNQATMKKPLKVDDMPKPIPKALQKMKEVGDEVGAAITRGAGKAARATKKALQGDSKEKE